MGILNVMTGRDSSNVLSGASTATTQRYSGALLCGDRKLIDGFCAIRDAQECVVCHQSFN
jgi:hypothetical protein